MRRSIESRWKWPASLSRRFHPLQDGLPAAYSRVVTDPALRVETQWEGVLPAEASRGERIPPARHRRMGAESFSLAEPGPFGAFPEKPVSHSGATPVPFRMPGLKPPLPQGLTLGRPAALQADVPAAFRAGTAAPASTNAFEQAHAALGETGDGLRRPAPLAGFAAFSPSTAEPDLVRASSTAAADAEGAGDAPIGAPDPVALVRSPARLTNLLRANLDTAPAPVPAGSSHTEQAPLTPVSVAVTPVTPTMVTVAPQIEAGGSSAHVSTEVVENVLDELHRRLELEFLRAYGTPGR